uniref:Uncharacterized protein n=1 Tax=Amphimedon queenslandica TaxID=400682 RepID=A0A1X7UZ72_AMPQE
MNKERFRRAVKCLVQFCQDWFIDWFYSLVCFFLNLILGNFKLVSITCIQISCVSIKIRERIATAGIFDSHFDPPYIYNAKNVF